MAIREKGRFCNHELGNLKPWFVSSYESIQVSEWQCGLIVARGWRCNNMAFIAFLDHACLHLFNSMELVKGAPMWLFGNLGSITLVGFCPIECNGGFKPYLERIDIAFLLNKMLVECDTSNTTSISLCKQRISLLNPFLLIFVCSGAWEQC